MKKLEQDQIIAEQNCEKAGTLLSEALILKEDSLSDRWERDTKSDELKLLELFHLTDEIISTLSPITPCASGCSNCCHINITVTGIEAALIAETFGLRCDQSMFFNKTDFTGIACPFFEDNKCSIYKIRPFPCRQNISIMPDEYWCHPDRCNDVTVSMIRFTGLEKAYTKLIPKGPFKDIRQWFSI